MLVWIRGVCVCLCVYTVFFWLRGAPLFCLTVQCVHRLVKLHGECPDVSACRRWKKARSQAWPLTLDLRSRWDIRLRSTHSHTHTHTHTHTHARTRAHTHTHPHTHTHKHTHTHTLMITLPLTCLCSQLTEKGLPKCIGKRVYLGPALECSLFYFNYAI